MVYFQWLQYVRGLAAGLGVSGTTTVRPSAHVLPSAETSLSDVSSVRRSCHTVAHRVLTFKGRPANRASARRKGLHLARPLKKPIHLVSIPRGLVSSKHPCWMDDSCIRLLIQQRLSRTAFGNLASNDPSTSHSSTMTFSVQQRRHHWGTTTSSAE